MDRQTAIALYMAVFVSFSVYSPGSRLLRSTQRRSAGDHVDTGRREEWYVAERERIGDKTIRSGRRGTIFHGVVTTATFYVYY